MYGTIAPADVENRNDAQPMFTPGALYHNPANGKTYKYVKHTDAVTVVAGHVAFWSDDDTSYTDSMVTNDFSECMTDTINDIRGVYTKAGVTQNYYTFIQTWGYNAAVVTNGDDDIAAGVCLIGAAADGQCNSMAANTAATNRILGWAVAADSDSGNTVAAFLTVER